MSKRNWTAVAAACFAVAGISALVGAFNYERPPSAANFNTFLVGLPPCVCMKELGLGDYCQLDAVECPNKEGTSQQTCETSTWWSKCDIEPGDALGEGSKELLLADNPCDGWRQHMGCKWDNEATPKCFPYWVLVGTPCPGFEKGKVDCDPDA